MTKPKKIVSLQTQYLVSALILGTFVIVAALITYSEIIKNSTFLSSRAREISQLLEMTSSVNINISMLDKAIDTFMLQPEKEEQRQIVTQKLNDTQELIASLRSNETIQHLKLEQSLQRLSEKITKLGESSEQLFNIRISATEQYPSLGISATMMRPLRNKLYTVFSVALQELRDDTELTLTPEINNLINAQTMWLRTISEYRLYLTNRFGSFNVERMKDQETQIESLIDKLKLEVDKILVPASNEYYGFEGNDLILTLPQLIKDWVSAYETVKKINNSGTWRRDSELMQTIILPLENEINLLLEQIDTTLEEENQQLMNALSEISSSQTFVLIGVISVFLLYIVASIFLLRTLLIKPISLIASTLKAEAHNPSSLAKLNLNKTRETKDLIDAFITMGNQVANRQQELEHHALHDTLTSLPNRMLLNQRLDYQTLIAARENSKFTLLFLDLNRFKEINDTLGHHVGDELLIQTGQRLLNLIRKVDTVARLGGDEFAIILPNTESHQAVVVALKIAQTLNNEFSINNYSLQISSSIGIAEYPKDGGDVQTMIQHADIAMYTSKRNKSVYEFYDPNEDTHSLAQLSLGRDLKIAIDNDQLEMYLQPKINLQNGLINGAEALLRWHHKEHGFVNPEKIIEIAEHIGMIDKLTYWIINTSIRNCSHANLPDNFDLSINLAVQSLRDSNLITETMNAIENNRGFKYRLTFEVTESAMMNNPEQSINILNALRKLGIRISIDDFGTGFSSLAYLKQLPVSQLKIDRSFVKDMHHDESDRTIVLSTINLSHSLGLDVVAEGVEDLETAKILKDMKCNTAQGYYFSKPVVAKEFYHFVANYQPQNVGF